MLKRLFGSKKPEAYSVLVLDDDPGVVRLIVGVLRTEGFTVHSANSGDDALKLLDQVGLPNVFIIDLKMPGMTGDEFLDRARIRFGKNAIPPVMLLSASPEAEERASDMDAADYLPKPFNNDTLLEHIWSLIERSEA